MTVAAAAGSLLIAAPVQAIMVGQTDTFENFEVNAYWGWRNGFAGNEAANLAVVTGGPSGTSDHYLQVSSGSFSPVFTQRLITLNRSQWIGDYGAPGIAAISMDLKNFSATARSMRIAFLEEEGGQISPGYVSQPFTLPTDSAWHHAEFSFASLIPVNNPHPLGELLLNTGGILNELRIYSAATATIIGDAGNFRVGIDNVQAIGPELVPGDFDGDLDVDGADFVVWQTNFPTASGAMLEDGDADGDGDVDGADFVVWQTNFPTTPGPAVSPVPEPASVGLAIVAFGCMIFAGRRTQQ